MKPDIEKLLKEIDSDLNEITKLSKSYRMRKAEEDEELQDFEPEANMEDEMGGDEIPADDMGAEAPAEEGFDASTLSDEELFSMVEQLMSEIENRQSEGGEETQPDVEPEPLASSDDEDNGDIIEEDNEPEDMDEEGEELADELSDEDFDEGREGGEESDVEDAVEDAVEDGSLEQELSMLEDEDFEVLQQAIEEEAANRGDVAEKAIRKAMYKIKKMRAKGNPEGTLTKSKKAKAKKVKTLKKSKQPTRKVNLKKSVDRVLNRLERLEKSAQGMPTQRYASGRMQVLEKSQGRPMTGPELANHLLAEQRKGNRLVKSIMVARANGLRESDEVENFYSELENLGVSLPRK